MSDEYTYTVEWSEEDGEFVGLCKEFPSLSWLDSTRDGALNGIRKVVEEVIEDMHCPICGGGLQPWDIAEPDPEGWCDLCLVKGVLVYRSDISGKRIQARVNDHLQLTFNAPQYSEYHWVMAMDTVYLMLAALCEVEHLDVGKSVDWEHVVHQFRAVRTPGGFDVQFGMMGWDYVFTLDQMQSFIGTLARMVEGMVSRPN